MKSGIQPPNQHPAEIPYPNDIDPLTQIIPREIRNVIFNFVVDERTFLPAFRNVNKLFRKEANDLYLKRAQMLAVNTQTLAKTQRHEIEHLMCFQDEFLNQNSGEEGKRLFKQLIDCARKFPTDYLAVLARDTLIDRVNEVIINSSIDIDSNELDCERRHITRFPGRILKDPRLKNYWFNIEALSFGYNELTFLPPEIGLLQSLKVVHFHDNSLRALPKELGELKQLEFLCLDGNKITEIPKEIGKLTSLETLYLSNNNIRILPEEISELKKLDKLKLDSNRLRTLPATLGQLTALELLVADDNQLTEIPASIGQLSSIKHIYINQNEITQAPAELGQLATLESLDLTDNCLNDLPFTIREELLYDEDGNRITKHQLLESQKMQPGASKKSRLG